MGVCSHVCDPWTHTFIYEYLQKPEKVPLELQAVVSHPTWLLGNQFRSSARAASPLNLWPISPVLFYIIFNLQISFFNTQLVTPIRPCITFIFSRNFSPRKQITICHSFPVLEIDTRFGRSWARPLPLRYVTSPCLDFLENDFVIWGGVSIRK